MQVIIFDVHYFNCALLMCNAGNIYIENCEPPNFDFWFRGIKKLYKILPAKILPQKGICGSELVFPNVRSCFFWNDFSFPMFLIIISCIFIQQREAFIIFAGDAFLTFYIVGVKINKYVYYYLGFGWARGLNFLYKEVTDLSFSQLTGLAYLDPQMYLGSHFLLFYRRRWFLA